MQTIIPDNDVLSIYHTSDSAIKEVLQKVLGKDAFAINLREKIKTFEDGLAFKNLTAADVLPVVPATMKAEEKSIHAYCKLIFLIEIFNEGWKPEISASSSQYKYWPWFIPSGSGLSLAGVADVYSLTDVASRLYLKSRELATWFANQFITLYEEYMLFSK